VAPVAEETEEYGEGEAEEEVWGVGVPGD